MYGGCRTLMPLILSFFLPFSFSIFRSLKQGHELGWAQLTPPLLNTTFGTHCHNWLNNLTPCHKDLTFTYKPIQQYPHRAQIAGSCTETQRKRAREWRTSVLTFLMSVSPLGGTLLRRDGGKGGVSFKDTTLY